MAKLTQSPAVTPDSDGADQGVKVLLLPLPLGRTATETCNQILEDVIDTSKQTDEAAPAEGMRRLPSAQDEVQQGECCRAAGISHNAGPPSAVIELLSMLVELSCTAGRITNDDCLLLSLGSTLRQLHQKVGSI